MTQRIIRKLIKKVPKKQSLREMKAKLMSCYNNCNAFFEAIREDMENLEMAVLANLEEQKKSGY